jgi:hypothetical protein
MMQTEDPVFSFQVHSKLITTKQLMKRLETLLPKDSTYKIEMQHNIHTVRVERRAAASPTSRGQ